MLQLLGVWGSCGYWTRLGFRSRFGLGFRPKCSADSMQNMHTLLVQGNLTPVSCSLISQRRAAASGSRDAGLEGVAFSSLK